MLSLLFCHFYHQLSFFHHQHGVSSFSLSIWNRSGRSLATLSLMCIEMAASKGSPTPASDLTAAPGLLTGCPAVQLQVSSIAKQGQYWGRTVSLLLDRLVIAYNRACLVKWSIQRWSLYSRWLLVIAIWQNFSLKQGASPQKWSHKTKTGLHSSTSVSCRRLLSGRSSTPGDALRLLPSLQMPMVQLPTWGRAPARSEVQREAEESR